MATTIVINANFTALLLYKDVKQRLQFLVIKIANDSVTMLADVAVFDDG